MDTQAIIINDSKMYARLTLNGTNEMKHYELEPEEQELLASIENGERVSVKDLASEKSKLQATAHATNSKKGALGQTASQRS